MRYVIFRPSLVMRDEVLNVSLGTWMIPLLDMVATSQMKIDLGRDERIESGTSCKGERNNGGREIRKDDYTNDDDDHEGSSRVRPELSVSNGRQSRRRRVWRESRGRESKGTLEVKRE
jgi:hypothetical protein